MINVKWFFRMWRQILVLKSFSSLNKTWTCATERKKIKKRKKSLIFRIPCSVTRSLVYSFLSPWSMNFYYKKSKLLFSFTTRHDIVSEICIVRNFFLAVDLDHLLNTISLRYLSADKKLCNTNFEEERMFLLLHR